MPRSWTRAGGTVRAVAPAGILLAALLGSILAAFSQFRPPDVAPATAPATAFSADRAMQQLRVVTAEPHPAGTPAHARVEAYLVEQLKALGLDPRVEVSTEVQPKPEFASIWAAGVHNIVARIPGTASTGAILLAAHYDSAPASPGASDCGACVATVLETARALRAGPPLANDVIVLLVDAEEHEMLGSFAFADRDPWARDVGLAINFEAIGSRGGSMLNYTTAGNGDLIRAVRTGTTSPLANSFLTALGIGNDTLQYTAHGAAGLEFVTIGNLAAYHDGLDNVATIDPRSMQHQGTYALGLARHFGALDLHDLSAPDAIFFNLGAGRVLQYPAAWAVPLAALVSLLFVAVLVRGIRRRSLGVGGIVAGFFMFGLGLLLAAIVVTGAWWAIVRLNPAYHVLLQGTAYGATFFRIAFVALAGAVLGALYATVGQRVRTLNLAAGALLWWAVLGGVTSLLVPAASYPFIWPLLVALIALLLTLLAPAAAALPWSRAGLAMLATVPGLVLMTPVVYVMGGLGARFELTGLIMAWLPIVFVVLLLGLLLPLLPQGRRTRWQLTGAALLLSGVLIGVGLVASGFDAEHPRPNHVAYVLDADASRATWISVGEQTDGWTARFLGAAPRRVEFAAIPGHEPDRLFAALEADAPMLALAPPEVEVLSDTTASDARTLRLHVVSPRGAAEAQVLVETGGAITAATVDGRPVDPSVASVDGRTRMRLQFYGLPREGFELELEVSAGHPVTLAVEDRSFGLPEAPGTVVTPRPPETMAAMFETADATIVRRTLALGQ